MMTIEDYEDANAQCIKIGDVDVAVLDVCQTARIMSEELRPIAESNLTKLEELGASFIDKSANSISDLSKEDIAGSASVFIFQDNYGKKMAAVRLDMDDDLSEAYASLLDYPVLDDMAYSENMSDYMDENKNEILDEVARNLFNKNPELEDILIEKDLWAEDILANEEVWKEIRACMGTDDGGWLINDMAEAMRIAESAIEEALEEQQPISPL